jgi:hypothetical protein
VVALIITITLRTILSFRDRPHVEEPCETFELWERHMMEIAEKFWHMTGRYLFSKALMLGAARSSKILNDYPACIVNF